MYIASGFSQNTNLLFNGGFEVIGTGKPDARDQIAHTFTWTSFKDNCCVDVFRGSVFTNSFNAYRFTNQFYLGVNEIDGQNSNTLGFGTLCGNRGTVYKNNPYSPFSATANVSYAQLDGNGGLIFINASYPGTIRTTYVDGLKTGGSLFIGMNTHPTKRVGVQQKFGAQLESGIYEFSYYWSAPSKYTSIKLKAFLSKDKDERGKKIATLEVHGQFAITEENPPLLFDDLEFWHKQTFQVEISLGDHEKYRWLVIENDHCGLSSAAAEASSYIFLDEFSFKLLTSTLIPNCTDFTAEDLTIDNKTFNDKTQTKNVRNSISTSGDVKIKGTSNITWTAKDFIELNAGFKVESGSTFKAIITECKTGLLQGKLAPDSSIETNILGENVDSIELSPNLGISIVPNPSNGVFDIIYESEEKDGCRIWIYDNLGMIVYQKTLLQNRTNLNLSHLTKGIYYTKIVSTLGVHDEVIIIQ